MTVTGTGFQDTGDLWCFTDCPIRVSRQCRGADSIATLEAVVSYPSLVYYGLNRLLRFEPQPDS